MLTTPSTASSLSIRFISTMGMPISGSTTFASWRWTSFRSTSSTADIMGTRRSPSYLELWNAGLTVDPGALARDLREPLLRLRAVHVLRPCDELLQVDVQAEHLRHHAGDLYQGLWVRHRLAVVDPELVPPHPVALGHPDYQVGEERARLALRDRHPEALELLDPGDVGRESDRLQERAGGDGGLGPSGAY